MAPGGTLQAAALPSSKGTRNQHWAEGWGAKSYQESCGSSELLCSVASILWLAPETRPPCLLHQGAGQASHLNTRAAGPRKVLSATYSYTE